MSKEQPTTLDTIIEAASEDLVRHVRNAARLYGIDGAGQLIGCMMGVSIVTYGACMGKPECTPAEITAAAKAAHQAIVKSLEAAR